MVQYHRLSASILIYLIAGVVTRGPIAAALDSTLAFIHVAHFPVLHQQMSDSQLGSLWQVEALRPFRDQLRHQGWDWSSRMERKFGVSTAMLVRLAQGELLLLVTGGTNNDRHISLVIEARDPAITLEFMDAAAQNLQSAGAVRSDSQEISSIEQIVLSFPEREVGICAIAGFVVISSDPQLGLEFANQVSRLAGQDLDTPLAELAGLHDPPVNYMNGVGAHLSWQCAPAMLLEAVAEHQNPDLPLANSHPGDQIQLAAPPVSDWKQQLDDIDSARGVIHFNSELSEIAGTIELEAALPRRGITELLDIQPGELKFPDFVPAPVSRCAVANWNIGSAIKRLAKLYDDVTETPGAFQQTVADVKQELNVDLEGDLFAILGPQVMIAGRFVQELNAEQTLIALNIQQPEVNADRVAEIINRLFAEDTETQQLRLPGQPHSLWQISFVSADERVAMAQSGLMVADGKLWCSTHASWIAEVLSSETATKLIEAPEFRQAAARWDDAATGVVLRSYDDLSRELEFTYETLRTKGVTTRDTSTSLLAILVGTAVGATHDHTSLDFKTLPEFAQVRDFLGTVTWSLESRPAGWHVSFHVFSKAKLDD
ncbi:MAG: hypothetical protein KF752_06400 [Pirellulaceae bacterium]|nr:hypothetical protein [Pirellulaceae bacterium]